MLKAAIAAPRFSWAIMSAMVPPPFVNGQEPKIPDKNRNAISAFKDGASAQPTGDPGLVYLQ